MTAMTAPPLIRVFPLTNRINLSMMGHREAKWASPSINDMMTISNLFIGVLPPDQEL
jgi:hypothetical protein